MGTAKSGHQLQDANSCFACILTCYAQDLCKSTGAASRPYICSMMHCRVNRLLTLPNYVASIAQIYIGNNQILTSKFTAQEVLGLTACDMTTALIVSVLPKLHFHQDFTAHNAVKQYTKKTQRNVLMHHCKDAAIRVQNGTKAKWMLPWLDMTQKKAVQQN